MLWLELRMSFLNERSVILENWMFVLPTLLLVLSYLYLKSRKGSHPANIPDTQISQNEKIKQLAESEYIGEYQEDGIADDDEYAPLLKDLEHIPFHGAKHFLEGGAARFYEIVNDRRSVRKYSSRKVDLAVIEKCIQAAG